MRHAAHGVELGERHREVHVVDAARRPARDVLVNDEFTNRS